MTLSLKRFAIAAAVCAALSTPAQADGTYPMTNHRDGFIDNFVIVGDVSLGNAGSFALFEMAALATHFYVPPEAAYLTMEASNPIIAQQWPFRGQWINYDNRNAQQCSYPIWDHNGNQQWHHGTFELTYTGYEDHEAPFRIRRGSCNSPVEDWAFYRPALYKAPTTKPHSFPTEAQAMETCGNESDIKLRALGCSDVIGNPNASAANVSWAYWSRAYVRCGKVAKSDTVADLVASARTDTKNWQEYYQRAGGYTGPLDGKFNGDLLQSIHRFADAGCR